MSATRRELVTAAIAKCQVATAKAAPLKDHKDLDVRELATAIHFLAFAVQEIGLAMTDESRVNDLPIQQGK